MNTESALQKKTLSIFFGTELWERYGFYIVQSLLTLFLAHHYGWPDDRIYRLAGSFTALTYLSPVIGGFIADRLIGQKATIILGTLVLFISYCALTVSHSVFSLEAALAGIAVGTGLIKPNISSLLGNTYPENSPKRESGFTVFYMGITSGIILGTIFPSILLHHFGWSITFASAALGMVFSASIFLFGMNRYHFKNYHVHDLQLKNLLPALGILLILWFLSLAILLNPDFANLAFALVVLCCIGYIIFSASKENPEQAKKTLVIGLLCFISTIFWAFYFQMFTSLTLFIARSVKPDLFGILFPAPYYVSAQSFGMLVFGYFLAKHYQKQEPARQALKIGHKFLAAVFFMTLAYGLIALVSNLSSESSLISPLWLIPAYLIISLAELLLSPTGLAAITILADHRKVSTMMGIFFVSLGIGAFLSGKLALLAAVDPLNMNSLEIHDHYAETFILLFGILAAALLLCGLVFLMIKRLFRA